MNAYGHGSDQALEGRLRTALRDTLDSGAVDRGAVTAGIRREVVRRRARRRTAGALAAALALPAVAYGVNSSSLVQTPAGGPGATAGSPSRNSSPSQHGSAQPEPASYKIPASVALRPGEVPAGFTLTTDTGSVHGQLPPADLYLAGCPDQQAAATLPLPTDSSGATLTLHTAGSGATSTAGSGSGTAPDPTGTSVTSTAGSGAGTASDPTGTSATSTAGSGSGTAPMPTGAPDRNSPDRSGASQERALPNVGRVWEYGAVKAGDRQTITNAVLGFSTGRGKDGFTSLSSGADPCHLATARVTGAEAAPTADDALILTFPIGSEEFGSKVHVPKDLRTVEAAARKGDLLVTIQGRIRGSQTEVIGTATRLLTAYLAHLAAAGLPPTAAR